MDRKEAYFWGLRWAIEVDRAVSQHWHFLPQRSQRTNPNPHWGMRQRGNLTHCNDHPTAAKFLQHRKRSFPYRMGQPPHKYTQTSPTTQGMLWSKRRFVRRATFVSYLLGYRDKDVRISDTSKNKGQAEKVLSEATESLPARR